MDWDHDVCLSCDNQTHDGEKFCSQACRLADLERAGCSEPPTPGSYSHNSPSWSSWQMSSSTTNTSTSRHHFQLAPPVNFSAYRANPNLESPPASPKSRVPARSQSTSYFPQQSASLSMSTSRPSGRGLTLSPSRTSLSSVSSSGSGSSSPGLSEQTLNQLRDYSGAFDTVRDWKRRVTFG